MTTASLITMTAVGDFMIQQRAEPDDIGIVAPHLEGADLKIANIDTVLSDLGERNAKYSNLRGPQGAVLDIQAMVFDVVTLANNHAMDFGGNGLLDMHAAFKRAGVHPVGAGQTLLEATAPLKLARGDRTVSIFSFACTLACTLPPGSAAGERSPGVAPLRIHQAYAVDESLAAEQPGSVPTVVTWPDPIDLKRACDAVALARQAGDIVLVALHWGVPRLWRSGGGPRVLDYQTTVGRAIIEAGADAVVGNHAHELHEIEMYQERPIFYSLGNFWIDSIAKRRWMGREAVAVKMEFSGEGRPELYLLPLLLNEQGVPELDLLNRAITVLGEICEDLTLEPTSEARWFRVS